MFYCAAVAYIVDAVVEKIKKNQINKYQCCNIQLFISTKYMYPSSAHYFYFTILPIDVEKYFVRNAVAIDVSCPLTVNPQLMDITTGYMIYYQVFVCLMLYPPHQKYQKANNNEAHICKESCTITHAHS